MKRTNSSIDIKFYYYLQKHVILLFSDPCDDRFPSSIERLIPGPEMFSRRFVTVSSEILKAVRHGDPVVALESTIITHGMPYPKNISMALKIEKILKDKVSSQRPLPRS